MSLRALYWFFVIAVQKACHPEERSGPCEGREGSVQREALNPAQPVPQGQRLNK